MNIKSSISFFLYDKLIFAMAISVGCMQFLVGYHLGIAEFLMFLLFSLLILLLFSFKLLDNRSWCFKLDKESKTVCYEKIDFWSGQRSELRVPVLEIKKIDLSLSPLVTKCVIHISVKQRLVLYGRINQLNSFLHCIELIACGNIEVTKSNRLTKYLKTVSLSVFFAFLLQLMLFYSFPSLKEINLTNLDSLQSENENADYKKSNRLIHSGISFDVGDLVYYRDDYIFSPWLRKTGNLNNTCENFGMMNKSENPTRIINVMIVSGKITGNNFSRVIPFVTLFGYVFTPKERFQFCIKKWGVLYGLLRKEYFSKNTYLFKLGSNLGVVYESLFSARPWLTYHGAVWDNQLQIIIRYEGKGASKSQLQTELRKILSSLKFLSQEKNEQKKINKDNGLTLEMGYSITNLHKQLRTKSNKHGIKCFIKVFPFNINKSTPVKAIISFVAPKTISEEKLQQFNVEIERFFQKNKKYSEVEYKTVREY